MARWVFWASTVIGAVITALVTMGVQPDLRSMLTLTLAALAVTLIAATLLVPAPSRRINAVQARREAPVAPRHCDPDAAGRPRPRAPNAV